MGNAPTGTLFTNDSGAAGGPTQFVQDAFQDISLRATNNTGLTDNASTNPLSNLFANDDSPRYGAKTLFIQDIVLLEDRSKWVTGLPTYQVIWSEPFPQALGYVWGEVRLGKYGGQTYVECRAINDGFGLGAIARRVQFICKGNTAATATGTLQVDGAGAATIDTSSLSADANTYQTVEPINAFVHAASNETQDLHDFRLLANQTGGTLRVVGALVYFENAGNNIELRPGTTYNNKTRAATTTGATLALPSLGSTLGGNNLIYKQQSGSYVASGLGATMLASVATGSSGTNLVTVSTGQGASFPVGTGVVTSWGGHGSSMYVGVVQSVSTDTLTVFPTLAFGISGALYKNWYGGQSLPINASLMMLAYTFGATEMLGYTASYLDNFGRFSVWSQNMGQTFIDTYTPAIAWPGASGFVQVEGYFAAAEVEYIGMSFALLSGTMCINGLGVYSHANTFGVTGVIKKTVFTDAGPGWNRFAFYPGSSHVNIGIQRINMYRRAYDRSPTFGLLAHFDTLQGFAERAENATLHAPGLYRRYFADQMAFKGQFVRGVTYTSSGGHHFIGASLNSSLRFEYYGKEFAILGLATSLIITIDGVSTSSAFNVIKSVATLGFHTVGISCLGASTVISGIDVFRSYGELHELQNYSPVPSVRADPTDKVIAKYINTDAAATTAQINFTVKEIDTHAAVTIGAAAWKFTAPKTAFYRVNVAIDKVNNVVVTPYINGNAYYGGTNGRLVDGLANNNVQSGHSIFYIKAGETFDLRPNTSFTPSALQYNYICIESM